MNKFYECIVFLPALIFWIGFAFFFYSANKIVKNPKYADWSWFGVCATIDPYNNHIFDFGDEP